MSWRMMTPSRLSEVVTLMTLPIGDAFGDPKIWADAAALLRDNTKMFLRFYRKLETRARAAGMH